MTDASTPPPINRVFFASRVPRRERTSRERQVCLFSMGEPTVGPFCVLLNLKGPAFFSFRLFFFFWGGGGGGGRGWGGVGGGGGG